MIPGTNRRGLLAGLTASVALTAITVFSLSGTRAQGDTAPAAPPAVPVSVATVEAREVVPWAEFSGRLEAIERVELRSRVAGVVEAVHFREGNLVKQGDLLVSIDQAPYLADLQRAEAQVQGAKARVALAESENERGQQLLATRNLSQRDVDTRVNNLREAQANLQAAEAARRTAQLNLVEVAVYEMRVKEQLPTWKEAGQRYVMWFPVEAAAELVEEPGLKSILASLRPAR